jgi:ABC-type uncharacterized transport system substrate-binding protein
MRGKLLINILILLLSGVVMPCLGWAAEPTGPVAILLSDSEDVYSQPVAAFRQEINLPVQIFNLEGDIKNDPTLKDRLLNSRPALIFALGAKAAYLAKIWTGNHQDIPVIFTMVLNWQRYDLLDQRNMVGIATELAPGTQFANMTIFSPKVQRIGVIHSSYSSQIIEQAQQAADLLGLELIDVSVERTSDFRRAFKKLSSQVDAFWVLNDPLIYTLDNMDWLEQRCVLEKLLCVGQTTNSAKMGFALAINPDIQHIGNQAAAIAKNIIIHGQPPKEIGVMPPLATLIYLNLGTAQQIGLRLSPEAMDMATSLIR